MLKTYSSFHMETAGWLYTYLTGNAPYNIFPIYPTNSS